MQNETVLKPKRKWKPTDNRFLGFIDIMGFKDMVARDTSQKIYNMMKSISSSLKEFENLSLTGYDTDLIRITTFSDSIVIASKNNSKKSLEIFIMSLSAISSDLLSKGVPHKGAVAYGEMTYDSENSIFFGQPLIDAYYLQEEVVFYGIVIHDSAEKQFSQSLLDNLSLIYKYHCPFKSGKGMHLVIAPLDAIFERNQGVKDRKLYKGLYKAVEYFRFRTSGHLRKYIENTIQLIETFEKETV